MTRILFVCTGNTCRSPMAVALFRHLADEVGLSGLEADSAGTGAIDGQPASVETRQALSERGIELGRHWSKQATAELVRGADLVLTMQASHRDDLHRQFSGHREKIQTIGEHTGGGDVWDPIGADLDDYRECADTLERLVPLVIARLIGEPKVLEEIPTDFSGRLFRVARPGRGWCGKDGAVPAPVVGVWARAVAARVVGTSGPSSAVIHYVCLLGQKGDGRREIPTFYAARGPDDPGDAPLFEDFLNNLAPANIRFRLHHFPATDDAEVSDKNLAAITTLVGDLLNAGNLVLVGCSAGEGRIRQVLRALGEAP